MLAHEKEETEKKVSPPAEGELPDLKEADRKKIKIGSIIGGVFLVFFLIILSILVLSGGEKYQKPKPNPAPRTVWNPFVFSNIHEESHKLVQVIIFNNRTMMEKNVSANTESPIPTIKNTTDNPEPVILRVDFMQLDEHLINIKYNDPEWPRWIVPDYGQSTKPYAHVLEQIRAPIGVGFPHRLSNTFEWNFFGKTHDILPLMTTQDCRLQYYDKYIEFEARVQTDYIYGMGERMESFWLKNDNYSLWNRDLNYDLGSDTEPGTYSSHPFFLNRLKDKKDFIGVLMRNSNAMLFSLWHTLNNGTFINYKMSGGIIDLYIFHAAEPDYILKQYHALIGRPYLPPVWAMGFQLARRGYSVENMKEMLSLHKKYRLPIDGVWADIDINDNYKAFTVNNNGFRGVKEFVEWLHDPNQGVNVHFVAIANPGIKAEAGYKYYDMALKEQCLIKSAAVFDKPYEGKTLAGTTVWFDFFLRKGAQIWAEGLHNYYELTKFDGIWISENEISNGCDGECKKYISADQDQKEFTIPNPFHNASEFDYLQYRPTIEHLERATLPMAAYECCDDFFYKQFYTHNLFGLQSTRATSQALTGLFEDKRFLLASRSTWVGSGHYGSHWLGDNYGTWQSMIGSIASILNFNMFGIPHVGAPIGGYYGNPDQELLTRWYELACFSPLMLSYGNAVGGRKEPFAFNETITYIRRAMQERYGYLRFMYTQMFEAHAVGGAPVHPLFFDFPEDETTYLRDVVDRTFMWGHTLYVIPTLIRGQTSTKAYLPNWRWYDLRSYTMVTDFKKGHPGDYFFFDQPLGHITVLIKGGSIIPYQSIPYYEEDKFITTELLKNLTTLIIIAPDHTGKASGTMVVDSEGIRPTPHPMSNTYRHYAFTYMNQIFRINKLAGFDFHQFQEYDYFNGIVILDVFGKEHIDYACKMDIDFRKKELQYWHMSSASTLMIFEEHRSKMPMYMLESIVWGSNDQHDFCKFQVHLSSIEYLDDLHTIKGELATSDPQSYQLKYDLKAFMITNKIVSLEIILNDHGKYPWIVPDVVDDNVRHTSKASINIKDSGLRFSNIGDPFHFELADPGDPFSFIFSSKNLPFVYLNNFINFKFLLNSKHVFGLGERLNKFELGDGTYSMFNKDAHSEETGVPPGNNMYGSHPFYLIHLQDPHYFAGIFFLNSNPIDMKIRHVGIHTQIDHIFVGGVIDAFIFQKESVEEVVKNYQYLIGRPEPLPYWAFGYHQSRWGYRDIEHLKDVYKKFEQNSMPLDALWMDKDYMDNYKTFTVNAHKWYGLSPFIEELHSKGKRFVAIVDAGISTDENYHVYKDGLERGVYLISSFTQEPLIGVTWPGYSVWIDFLHPAAEQFWEETLQAFHGLVPFDGLWLDMNEPSNFCDGECPDGIHYLYYHFPLDFYDDLYYNPTHRGLERGTVSMEALHYSGTVHQPEFNYHNLYGLLQSRATARFFNARLRRRAFVVSSSTFPGIGKYASHWLGDNYSTWHMMEYSIAGAFNFQLFGIPFIGADICGFNGNATISLCSRWMQLGAFYPFMRNHNSPSGNPQEPYVDPLLASVSRKAIRTRYSLARYLYSEYMRLVVAGGMMFTPILFSFPEDPKCYNILDTTFMFGHAIRVDPVLEDKKDTLLAYFPNWDWFEMPSLKRVMRYNSTGHTGSNITLHCSLESEKLNMHIKGGSIFTYQEQALTTGVMSISQLPSLPVSLIIALDHSLSAKGYAFYDNDEQLHLFNREYHDLTLVVNQNKLSITAQQGNLGWEYKNKDNTLTKIQILGGKDLDKIQCVKAYDNKDKAYHTLKHEFSAENEILSIMPSDSYTLLLPRIEHITWLNTTC